MVNDLQLVLSGDGSHTLFVNSLEEHYHSINGAFRESEHVFLKAGYDIIDKDQINILEVGFGTGLNVLLTFLRADEQKKQISYTASEPFPLERHIWATLNYPCLLQHKNSESIFQKMHEAEWEEEVRLSDKFMLLKTKRPVEQMRLTDELYDLVYFDAFSPEVQPELWTRDVFLKVYKSMQKGGILVTYSSKGIVKRNMRDAGFEVQRLPGEGVKRHMVRGLKAVGSRQ